MQVVNIRLTQYAVQLSRKDLRLLVGLLTVHSGEEEDISLHLSGNCCAIAEERYEFFGRYFLGTGDLRQEHWSILLRFAKTRRRFL